MALKDIQKRLVSMGYGVGNAGADGLYGRNTESAINAALNRLVTLENKQPKPDKPVAVKGYLPILSTEWLPSVPMKRVHAHWTAGTHKATQFDREHYHFLFEADAKAVRGVPTIDLNSGTLKDGYAKHTLNANSYAIGVSLCCMGGDDVKESPFNAGKWPMTKDQWNAMIHAIAQLCDFYNIKVSPTTVLSHAEVGANLGIPQRGKWDFTRLSFDLTTVGAKACGDKMRREVAALL
jgi:hypothetical protein